MQTSTPLSCLINRARREKNNNEWEIRSNSINKCYPIGFHRIHLKTAKYIFFSSAYGTTQNRPYLAQSPPWQCRGFPHSSVGKESACNAGDPDSIPGSGRSPGGGHSNLLQCSSLENPHRQKSLAGYSPQGCKELDTTERLSTALENSKRELFLIALLFPVTF